MKKQAITRAYNFSDAQLVTRGKEKIAFARRDKTAFATFGITAAMITEFEAAINAFSETITDTEARNDQIAVSEAKNAKGEELRTAIRNVMGRAQLVYGANSSKYKQFSTETLSQQPDAQLLLTGKIVVRLGTLYLAELASSGLTAAMLTALTALCNAFEGLVIDQKIKMHERNILQESRIIAGNAVYNTLMRYSAVGQTIWETVNVARYNDYIVYSGAGN